MITCIYNCSLDDWCMCEAIEAIEVEVKCDTEDLSEKDKKFYFLKLEEKIRRLK